MIMISITQHPATGEKDRVKERHFCSERKKQEFSWSSSTTSFNILIGFPNFPAVIFKTLIATKPHAE